MHVAPRIRSLTPPPLTFAGPAAEIIQVRRRAVDVAVPQSPGPSNPGCSLGERTRKTQRIAAVWHASPQKMVGVLFALLLAAAMAVGSGANFTTSSSNVGNMVTAGKLSLSNSKSGAIFTVNPMRPDDAAQTGTVQLANTGDGPGAVTLNLSSLVDTNTVNPGSLLSTKLNLKVDECTDLTCATTVATKYNGLVSAFPGAGVNL